MNGTGYYLNPIQTGRGPLRPATTVKTSYYVKKTSKHLKILD